jgi:hypothetical protein
LEGEQGTILRERLVFEAEMFWSLKIWKNHGSGSLGTPCHNIWVGNGYERWSRSRKGIDVICTEIQAMGNSIGNIGYYGGWRPHAS